MSTGRIRTPVVVGRAQLGWRVVVVYRIELRDQRWWLDAAILLRGRRWMWFVTKNSSASLPPGSVGGATAGCHGIGFDPERRTVLLDECPGIAFAGFNVILCTGAGSLVPPPIFYDRLSIDADLAPAESGSATAAIAELCRRLELSPQVRRYLRGLPASSAAGL